MSKEAPQRIFRHRGYTRSDLDEHSKVERFRSELKEAKLGKVWFSQVSAQNDPFDTNPAYEESSLREVKSFMEEFRRIAGARASFYDPDFVTTAVNRGYKKSQAKRHLRNYKQTRRSVRQVFEQHQGESLVCCFTEDPHNILMWSYYSCSHASFNYEFSLQRDKLETGKSVIADVRYVTERPRLTTIDMLRRMAQVNHPKDYVESLQDQRRIDDATLLCKSSHWQHEKEWRSLRTPQSKPGYYSISPYKLTGVTFGCRAQPELVSFVKSQLSGEVEFRFLELSGSTYELRYS
ncbi:DUF2971 domain-containing protein [Phaeobacter inhibens]|uniref:DUF2971 domain-containing protein n=1 Tax=Phaeobacter inhibens TaxID=221822 RepID=UPI002491D945|nr:DUF2971 domain-containing protein [Phaeobacter inhibens]